VAVERANFVISGVPLPAGAKLVHLTFDNDRNATGRLITLGALLAALGWAVAGLLADRRSVRG
jgi:nitrate/nitrite transporter NarK